MRRITDSPAQSFLVLLPAAVGCLLGYLLLDWRGVTRGFAIAAMTVALVFALAGAWRSVAVIRQPLRSYRLLSGVGRSPLSRQAALVTLFLLLLLVDWILALADVRAVALTVVNVVIGSAAVMAAGLVYMLPAQPAWRHWSTLVAVLSGLPALGVAAAMVIALGWREDLLTGSAGAVAGRIVVVAGIVALAVASTARSAFLDRGGPRTEEGRAAARRRTNWPVLMAACLVVAAAGSVAGFASGWTLIASFVAVAAALALHWRLFFLTASPLSWRSEVPGLAALSPSGKER